MRHSAETAEPPASPHVPAASRQVGAPVHPTGTRPRRPRSTGPGCRMKGPIFVAQRVVVTLFDDIDGGEASETVAFGLDGTSYEIDLNRTNAEKLRETLEPYLVEAASAPPPAAPTSGPPSPPTPPQCAPGPARTRWTYRRADASRSGSTRRSNRPTEAGPAPGRARDPGVRIPVRAADLRDTPGDQLEFGARRGARPTGRNPQVVRV